MINGLPDVAWPLAIFLLAVLWDLTLGEPALHPVSAIGRTAAFLETRSPGTGRVMPFLYGLGMAILVPATFAATAYAVTAWTSRLHPAVYLLVSAFLLKSCFSVRGLALSASRVGRSLQRYDIVGARHDLKSLVSRDTIALSAGQAASAAVESVAENTTDSFVAPWLAFALFGLPGVLAYRALNTLDSMVGYRGRYEYLGKASARLDDLANLIPARLAAVLIVICGYPGRAYAAWQTMWQQHSRTSSPNAGWTMSAMSGLLGVKLCKPDHYELGLGNDPSPAHIRTAVGVMYRVGAMASALTLGVLLLRYGL